MTGTQPLEKRVYIRFLDQNLQVVKTCGPREAQTKLFYVERNCFGNSCTNQIEMQVLAGEPLEIVAGSLGLCAPAPTWYEWGGYNDTVHTTVHQFRRCTTTGMSSCHFWLQGVHSGKIWDVLDPYLVEQVAPPRHKTINVDTLVHGWLCAGLTVEELERCGLKYVRTELLIEKILLQHHTNTCRQTTLL